jgi:hypothetical protein
MADVVISSSEVTRTIDAFTKLDQRGDRKAMGKLAGRLQKEQPFLLRYAAQIRGEHGDTIGEAAIFYATLIWSMFDRLTEEMLPQLTENNLQEAEVAVTEAISRIAGLMDKDPYDRVAEPLVARQPHVYEKLRELLKEDVTEAAMTADTCAAIIKPIQVVVEAFDAALGQRRPGHKQGPIIAPPRTGRNEPCPCGSGKKFKKCHGGAA